MIHVCFGLHDKTGRYSKFTGTAMLSMFDNHNPPPMVPSITVHILHDNTLSTDNRDKFSYIAGQYGQLVKFYNVEELCADRISKMINLVPAVKTSRVSVGAFYRLLISQLLSTDIDKAIYLDSDIIVNLDIKELWQIELYEKMLAAAPEIKISYLDHPFHVKRKFLIVAGFVNGEDYFNSGVLLMNLKILRNNEEAILNGVKFRGEHTQCDCFDQDIWNYLCSKNYVKLSEKFDVMVGHERRVLNGQNHIREVIYHYGDSPHGSGFGLDMSDPFNRLWMKYFMRTPWFDVEAMGRLYAGVQQIHIGLKQSMANVSAMMSGKNRAFFTAPQSVDAVKKIFSVRNDEEIILAENQTSLQNLIDNMNSSRGRKIFFILLQGFPFQILNQAGFVAGRDFVNGFEFLSEAHGVNFNSYPLIKAM